MKSIFTKRRLRKVYLRSAICVLFVPIAIPTTWQTKGSDTGTQGSSNLSDAAHSESGGKAVSSVLWQEAESLLREQRAESSQKAIEKYRAVEYLCKSSGAFELATRAARSIGDVYIILGDLKSAVASFNEALQLSRKANSRGEKARALNGLAYANFLKGDAVAAYDYSKAALKLSRVIKDRQAEAAALSNLGESVYSFGDLQTAQTYQQQARDLWRELGDLRGQALSQIALGYYHAKLGEPQAALNDLQQGLEASQQAGDMRTQALALNAMGNIKAKLGRKQEALDAYASARPLAERIGDKLFLASILGGNASLYYWMGDAQRTLGYSEQVLKLFEDLGADWGIAETKLDLGRINNSLGEHDKAIQFLTQALSLFRKLRMRRLEAQSLREIGLVKFSTGEFVSALDSFQQAVKLTRIGQDYRYEASALNLIGKVYENLNQPEVALGYFGRALPISRVAGDPAVEADTLFNIARIERDRGNLVDAEKNLELAIERDESIRAMVSSQDLRASFLATIHGIYELYIDVLLSHYKIDSKAGFEARAFAISEKARARSFLDALQESQTNIREGVDPSLIEKERSLSETLNAKADRHLKLLAEKNLTEADKVKKDLDNLTAEYAAIRDQIRATSPKYAALTLPEPLNLQAVQQQVLDDDSILLEYSLGEERSYVWLVSRTDVSTYELRPRKEIEDSARHLYDEFVAYQLVPGESVEKTKERQSKAAETIPIATATLSKLILGPLSGKLGNKRLLIISDGALQALPFSALHDPDSRAESPRFLFVNHEIVSEPSASTLAALLAEARARIPAANSVAVLADPVFEVDDPRVKRANVESTPESAESLRLKQALRDIGISTDGVQIPRLFASSEEANAIIKTVPWGTGLKALGFEATRERVMSNELGAYRVIHFATHGLMNNEHPELSGIVLSLFDQQGHSQNGFLRLHDIYNLRLPADLVVLSACSTGLGKDIKGEGLIGLTRGFMYAGASGVVASLWKVDDEATAVLMKEFYEGLFVKRLSPAAALREAQLSMSKQTRWKSPYYWAGFVIQGRYDELIPGNQWSYFTLKRIAVFVVTLTTLLVASLLIHFRMRRQSS